MTTLLKLMQGGQVLQRPEDKSSKLPLEGAVAH